ncbi:MAG: T9SS type A sorting domain-containing protein [Flavobacteriales bacterium]|nr:T9SS type A sorting domain-containing protein [Flavobacteriales bacterium]
MRTISTILALLSVQAFSFGQCSSVGVQISSSDTNQIQLYHAGFFNIDSGYANVCEWEVTTFQGTVVHQAITSGDWPDQSFSLFNHSVPITDSMQVTLFITNPIAGITCSITDTLVWEETEVIPGAFIGNWSVLGDYVGVENELVTSIISLQTGKQIQILPSVVTDWFVVSNIDENHSIVMFDSMGRKVFEKAAYVREAINVQSFKPGMYYVHICNANGYVIDVKKMMKM